MPARSQQRSAAAASKDTLLSRAAGVSAAIAERIENVMMQFSRVLSRKPASSTKAASKASKAASRRGTAA